MKLKDKSNILKWITIAFCMLFILAISSVFIFKAVKESDWYHEYKLKEAFQDELLHINEQDKIIYVGISPKGDDNNWKYFRDVPDYLFDDMTCDNYDEIDDPDKVKEILGYDWIMVIFKDASKSLYFISPQDEIYWGTSFPVECPSLLNWYKDNK